MINKFFLLKCINEIIKERQENEQIKQKSFASEAEFQFALAWKLKEKFSDKKHQIYLEMNPTVIGLEKENSEKFLTANSRIDIILEIDGKLYPIELKYKYLKKDKNNAGGENNFLLGFHKDICRMEVFKEEIKNCEKFFCIAMTNQNCIHNGEDCRDNTRNKPLRLHECCKKCSFDINKNKTINLDHETYECKWEDIELLENFKVLIIEN